MTNEELAILQAQKAKAELAKRAKARLTMSQFVPMMHEGYQIKPYHQYIMDRLDAFNRGEIKRLIISVPAQHGKQLADNQLVMTKEGWKTHGDLKVGDYVYGRKGQPVKVLHVFPKEIGDRQVTFSDGTKIKCHENHEWVVFDKKRGTSGVDNIVETKFIEQGYKTMPGRRRFLVDYNVAIEREEVSLKVPPYVLGAWLGDGTKNKDCISHPVKDTCIAKEIESYGYSIYNVYKHPGTGVLYTFFNELKDDLQSINVWNNKHIPEIYLSGSIQQRLDLLAGLIDTDGYTYHKNGRITFSNTNVQIIDSVRALLISLGCSSSVSEYEPQLSTGGVQGRIPVYQVGFNPHFDIPCVVKRKRPIKLDTQRKQRGIVKVEKVEPFQGNCVTVEGGVYLVGETMIPTHNSELSTRLFVPFHIGSHPGKRVAVISYAEELAQSFNRDIKENILSPTYQNIFPEILMEQKGWATTMAMLEYGLKVEKGTPERAGAIRTTSIGGSLTGFTVDTLVLDDLFKDFEDAQNPANRQKVWNWFYSTANSRLDNNAQILFVMTRWHEEDLAGRLIALQRDKWEVIRFPAVMDESESPYDPRKIGEALWPEKHSLEKLLDIKEHHPVTFNAVYQQDPKPPEDTLIFPKWGKLADWKPTGLRIYGLDFGFQNDPTALIEIWVDKNTIRVRELIYESGILNPELIRRMKAYSVRGVVICDTNEPKTLVELRQAGFTIQQAIKGPNSIKPGIRKLKEFNVMYSRDSHNIEKEKNNYQYLVMDGRITDEPGKHWNHAIDAIRMAIYTWFYRGRRAGDGGKKQRVRTYN